MRIIRKYLETNIEYCLTRKSTGDRQVKRRNKEEKNKEKTKEHEGMPQHQHCPPAKRRGDRNPKYNEDQQKDAP
jgi:hypothetical protein